jgi:uncharacterized protein (DUF2147 family)
MKKVIITTLMGLLSVEGYSQKATDNFTGKWKTDKGVVIYIEKKENRFVGTTASNTILNNLHFVDDAWKGTLIKPENNEQFNCTAILEGNKLKLTIKKGIVSKTIVWIK